MNNYLTTDWLNLRSDPSIPPDKNSNVIGVLPPETVVEKLLDQNINDWFHIKTFLGKKEVNGFTSTHYLMATQNALPQSEEVKKGSILEAHLSANQGKVIRRNETLGRAYPLSEAGVKKFEIAHSANTAENIQQIHEVLEWLDVEHSQRYAPTNDNTYCNIYAYDVAYCCGAYIPRVWWNEKAFEQIKKGPPPQAIYEKTVTELNANALTDWFENYGPAFHWERILDKETLQNKVNTGMLGVIVAQRINLNRSGHIVAVVPETSDFQAQRDANKKIVSPLQSQAGMINKKLFTSNNWWVNPNKFRKFGLWVMQAQ